MRCEGRLSDNLHQEARDDPSRTMTSIASPTDTSGVDLLLMKLRARDEVSAAEAQALRDAFGDVRDIPADRTLIRAGDDIHASTLLVRGLLCRYKDLRDGFHRIITNFNAEAEGVRPETIVRRLAEISPRDPNEEALARGKAPAAVAAAKA